MDAFPALTIIAHVETKKEMDLFGPGSAMRDGRGMDRLQKMLETGKTPEGQTLTEDDRVQVKNAIARRMPALEEIKKVKFLGRSNTDCGRRGFDRTSDSVHLRRLSDGVDSNDAEPRPAGCRHNRPRAWADHA
jgi:hypothetical protein